MLFDAFVYFQSIPPFHGVWTMIFSKWTAWFPPRTTYLHKKHDIEPQHQVNDPILDLSQNIIANVFWLHIWFIWFILLSSVKSNPAKPTIAYAMHVSKEPQDDGYTLMPSPGKVVQGMNESKRSPTLDSSSDIAKSKKSTREVRSHKFWICNCE